MLFLILSQDRMLKLLCNDDFVIIVDAAKEKKVNCDVKNESRFCRVIQEQNKSNLIVATYSLDMYCTHGNKFVVED